MNFSSKLIEEAVEAFASLPGIGKKTALRLVLHLIKEEKEETHDFVNRILKMRDNIQTCNICHNLSDLPVCHICTDSRRDRTLLCVVESIRDVMAIEDTAQFRGLYHVLGGIISPIEGIGPADLNIESLMKRLNDGETKEIIMAISPTIEGETTIYFLSRQIRENNPLLKISTIARGVSFGGDLEYADELTLGRSIAARIPYHTTGE